MSTMSKRPRKKGKSVNRSLARNEVNPLVSALIAYGKRIPGVQGIARSLTPLAPGAMRVVLDYAFNVQIVTTVGELDSYVFRGNGMFDPDVTGVGGQPLGFDQWHEIYLRNRVLASSIEFTCVTVTSDTSVQVTVFPSALPSLPTAMTAGQAQPWAKTTTLTYYKPAHLRSSMETSLINALPVEGALIDDNLAGSSVADPAEVWYWIVQTQPSDQATATTLRLTGRIHYLVDFFDRNLYEESATLPSKRSLKLGKK